MLFRSIHRRLGIETLEELEIAAHDGRLEGLEGFGARRVRGIRDALAGILGRSARRRARRMRWLEGADHSFHVLKRSGRTDAEVLDELATTVAAWAAEAGPGVGRGERQRDKQQCKQGQQEAQNAGAWSQRLPTSHCLPLGWIEPCC